MRVRIAILGGGPAGYEAALVAVELGAEVTLIERDGIGGACVLTDCVPSKTLVSSAEVRTTVDGADALGLTCSQMPVDAKRLNRRILDLAHAQSEDIRSRLVREGVEVIDGARAAAVTHHDQRPAQRGGLRGAARGRRDPAGDRLDPARHPRQRAGRRAHPRLAAALRPGGDARASDRHRLRRDRRGVRLRVPGARLAR